MFYPHAPQHTTERLIDAQALGRPRGMFQRWLRFTIALPAIAFIVESGASAQAYRDGTHRWAENAASRDHAPW
jgi:hypothetical protein